LVSSLLCHQRCRYQSSWDLAPYVHEVENPKNVTLE
jgi:hypothetical protein